MLVKLRQGWQKVPAYFRVLAIFASGAWTAIMVIHPRLSLAISGIIWALFILVIVMFNVTEEEPEDNFYERNGHHKGVITFIDEKKDHT